MNVIGIDYQQTQSEICLREGSAITYRLDSVGDGLRHLIPHAVFQDGTWGSQAMLRPQSGRITGAGSSRKGPWLDEAAAILWQGIHNRLYHYLGRMNPGPENGYQVVVGIQAVDHEESAAAVKRLCSAARLSETTVIRATHALLCRWMAEDSSSPNHHPTVVAVALGDSTITVTAYRVRMNQTSYPSVIGVSPTIHLSGIGHLQWLTKIINLIEVRFRERFVEAPPPGYDLNMRDAVLRFAAQLSRAAPDQQVEWTGLFREKLYAPFRLARKECAEWPEVTAFEQSLSSAIIEVTGEVGRKPEPDVILLGGVGALWPFARDFTARSRALVCQSENPLEDVAHGAAWWPAVGEESAEALGIVTQSAGGLLFPTGNDEQEILGSIEEPAADEVSTDEPCEEVSETEIVPPWERQ
jgi:hypothetical protein